MNSYYNTLFQQAQANLYISNLNVCAPDWGENDITLDFSKIYYFLDGDCKLIIDGDAYYPQPGEMYFIPSGTCHSFSHNPKHPVYKYWCHFSLRFGDNASLLYHRDTVFCIPDSAIAVPIFQKLCELSTPANYQDYLLQKSCLLELCHLFLSSVDTEKMLVSNEEDFCYILNNYISKHLSDTLSVQELAKVVHLQPNYFINKFKKSFGETPTDYINTLRLDAAVKELSTNSCKSIGDIARQFGYNDYRYFDRIFKRRYGVTPGTFRKVTSGQNPEVLL